jgi:hypothetical protein
MFDLGETINIALVRAKLPAIDPTIYGRLKLTFPIRMLTRS